MVRPCKGIAEDPPRSHAPKLVRRSGDYVQSKYFRFTPAISYGGGYGTEAKGDQIPSRILFDMHLGPVNPSVDVNVVPAN
jgi:hypothetical protein